MVLVLSISDNIGFGPGQNPDQNDLVLDKIPTISVLALARIPTPLNPGPVMIHTMSFLVRPLTISVLVRALIRIMTISILVLVRFLTILVTALVKILITSVRVVTISVPVLGMVRVLTISVLVPIMAISVLVLVLRLTISGQVLAIFVLVLVRIRIILGSCPSWYWSSSRS